MCRDLSVFGRLLSALILTVLAACGAGDGSGGNNSNNSNNSSNTGGTYQCCLNGQFYSCGDKAAFDKCAGFDVGACHAGCEADFSCHMNCDLQAQSSKHDPSACSRDASRDGTCTISSGGSCREQTGLTSCTYSTQCSSNNCTKGKCYGNENGDLCTYSTQCKSNNCTNGCCAGNAVGSTCTYSTQCDSNNCTNGKCQGRTSGSPCTYSTQCNSNNCTSGRCA